MFKIKKIFRYIKVFFKFRKYLDNGIFYYKNRRFTKNEKSAIFLINFSFKKVSRSKSVKVSTGKWSKKVLIFFDDFIFNDLSYHGIEFFKRFIDGYTHLNYKKMEVYNIDVKKCTFFTRIIKNAVIPSNDEEYFWVLNTFLDYGQKAEKYDENIKIGDNQYKIQVYYQQKDTDPSNVLIKDSELIFIDLDYTQKLPLFFDFFRALTIVYPSDGLAFLKNGNFYFSLSNIFTEKTDYFIDLYLSAFVSICQDHWLYLLGVKNYKTVKRLAGFLNAPQLNQFPILSKIVDSKLLEFLRNWNE